MDCFIVFSGISTNLEAFAKDLTTNDVNHMEAWNQQNSKENCTGVKWGKKLVKIFGKLGKAYVHYDMTWLEKSFYEGLEEWGLKCEMWGGSKMGGSPLYMTPCIAGKFSWPFLNTPLVTNLCLFIVTGPPNRIAAIAMSVFLLTVPSFDNIGFGSSLNLRNTDAC